MARTKEFREFDSAILADRLAFMAIALFVIYLITLLASILPVRLLDTAWPLRFISACLDTATIPLVALGLLHLAAYLDPGNPSLQKRRDGLARLANVARLQAIQAPSLRIRIETQDGPLPDTQRRLAIAFAMGAQRKGRDVPLLVEWHTRFCLGGLQGAAASEVEAHFSQWVQKKTTTPRKRDYTLPSETLPEGGLAGTIAPSHRWERPRVSGCRSGADPLNVLMALRPLMHGPSAFRQALQRATKARHGAGKLLGKTAICPSRTALAVPFLTQEWRQRSLSMLATGWLAGGRYKDS